MGIDTVALMELFTRHRDKSGRVDTFALASELGEKHEDPAQVLEQFLGLPDTGDWRYYEFDIMRKLAEQGQLSKDEALRFLEKMCSLSLYARLDADEFYDTIYAIARSKKTAPVLLEFVEDHLLAKKDVRDWRWLAFTAVGEVVRKKTALIPEHLMEILRNEADKEEDAQRKRQLREFLYLPEIKEIYATGKVGGVTVRDSLWREALRFEADSAKPSLVATFEALRALYDVNKEYARKFIKKNCPKLDKFVMNHYDKDLGGFRHHAEAVPSLYGTFWAVLSIPWAWDVLGARKKYNTELPPWVCLLYYFQQGNESEVPIIGLEYLKKILGFIGLCLSSSNDYQAFADTVGGQPTIMATDGSIQLLDSCGAWSSCPPRDIKIPENLSDPIAVSAKLVDFITACRKPGSLGFANHPREQLPQSDVTRHCFRTLVTLKKILQADSSTAESDPSCQETLSKIDSLLEQRNEVAKFLEDCKKDSGFAKFKDEKPSIIYTDLALRCLWEYLYLKDAKKMEQLVRYDALLLYLEALVFPGKLGFAPGSAQNIFCIRAATSILSMISEVYPAEAEREKDRFGKLEEKLEKTILEHQVTGTPLFAAYKTDRQVNRGPEP